MSLQLVQTDLPTERERQHRTLIATQLNESLRFLNRLSALEDFADDDAAATGGVSVGSLYRTGSVIKVRVA